MIGLFRYVSDRIKVNSNSLKINDEITLRCCNDKDKKHLKNSQKMKIKQSSFEFESEWVFDLKSDKYFFSEEDDKIDILQIALWLLSIPITISQSSDMLSCLSREYSEGLIEENEECIIYYHYSKRISLGAYPLDSPYEVNESNFERLWFYLERLENILANYADLIFPFKIFYRTENFYQYSQEAFVFNFTVLESLLTHKPKDEGDSINTQLKNKSYLLKNRDESYHFKELENLKNKSKDLKNVKWETLIAKLYEYRSAIVHGSSLDLQKTIFKDQYLAHYYLNHLVKGCLIQTLIEPQLMRDLRNC